jgi:hypothetical protein
MRKTIPAHLRLLAGTAVLALALSACGSGGNGNATGSTGSNGSGSSGEGGGKGLSNDTGGRPPGVSGKVAAVSGKTAQVQDQTSQTAVTWTAKTTFTEEVSTTAAAVKVGTCVIAQPAPSTSASSGGSTGSTDGTTVAAASVRIISTSGDCAQRPAVFDGGGRGSFSGGPSGGASGAPSSRPSGLPSGGPGRQVGFGAVGKVTALAAHGFTVQAVLPSGSGASPTTRSVSVTTTAATTYTTTRKATASAVKVGTCLSAQGSTDSIGGVTATRVQLTQPVDGQCGFRIFRGGPGGAGAGTGGTTAGNA